MLQECRFLSYRWVLSETVNIWFPWWLRNLKKHYSNFSITLHEFLKSMTQYFMFYRLTKFVHFGHKMHISYQFNTFRFFSNVRDDNKDFYKCSELLLYQVGFTNNEVVFWFVCGIVYANHFCYNEVKSRSRGAPL